MTKTKKIIISILVLTGLALSIELCFVYYNVFFSPNPKPSICAINEAFDCDRVAGTQYSQFLGIPLSYWGIFLYCFFLFMTFIDKIKNIKFLGFLKVFKNPSSYIFCISLLSFILSMCLFSVSYFKINSLCIFCLMTYFIDLFIAIVSKTKGISIIDEIKISFSDFIEAARVKRYLISLIIIISVFAGILAYTSISDVFAPQVALKKEMQNSFKHYDGAINGSRIGPEDADLVIHEYIDFNCGGCFIANLYMHRIVKEFENVAVIQHNLPLDGACNHNVEEGGGHENSCLKAYYALAAAEQNKYWQMGTILFDSDVKTEKDIIKKAAAVNLNIKKLQADANSDEIKRKISDSVADADARNIQGTPTIFVGLKELKGIGPYPVFKEIVTEQGGKEKANHG